jgi:hypothetical protein
MLLGVGRRVFGEVITGIVTGLASIKTNISTPVAANSS